eukprot:10215725-Prorocentrum_lima.AAC.1
MPLPVLASGSLAAGSPPPDWANDSRVTDNRMGPPPGPLSRPRYAARSDNPRPRQQPRNEPSPSPLS